MADAPKYVLFFSQKKIRTATIGGSAASLKIEQKDEIPWITETLSETLIDIKRRCGNASVLIMVDDDLAFTFGITVPADIVEERNFVRIKAAETVPEMIDDFGWDFKDVLESVDKKNKIVQFASLDDQFYAALSKAVRESEIKITAIEPMTCSLARLLEKEPEPSLVIYKKEKILMFLTYHGLVFAVESFDAEPTPEVIGKFLAFAKEEFGFAPKTVFLSGKFSTLGDTTPGFAGWKVTKGELDPFQGIARKLDMAGKDEATLNIVIDTRTTPKEKRFDNKIVGISETGKEPGMESYEPIGLEEDADQGRVHGLVFNTIILVASFLVLLGNGFILYQRNQEDKIFNGATVLTPSAAGQNLSAVAPTSTVSTPSGTAATIAAETTTTNTSSSPTIAVASSSPVIDFGAYTIEILNGGGVTGAAKTLAAALTARGFKISTVGNAPASDSTSTVVDYKDSVPSNYRNALGRIMRFRYNFTEGPSVDAGENFDVEIVIGKT